MDQNAKLLWVGEGPMPANVRAALEDRWEVVPYRADGSVDSQLDPAPLAVIHVDGDPARVGTVLRQLERTSAVAVVLLPGGDNGKWDALSRRRGQFVCVSVTASPAELSATLAAAAALQPAIRTLHRELSAVRDIAARDGGTTVQDLQEEMRLASRLQQDFLPRSLPAVGPVRFGVLFRPAGWVSGDFYDVFRLDETHVGFYLADAVGHGMPAALLTMFIKKALQTKRITGNTYEIVPPAAALAQLNADLCQQELSSCHFCTAIYAVVDTAALRVTFARAGHPEMVLIRRDGTAELLPSPGSLLGVFLENDIQAREVCLGPGDRLVAYSDGGEEAACYNPHGARRDLVEVAAEWAGLPRDGLVGHLGALADAKPPGDRYDDDITFLVADVEG